MLRAWVAIKRGFAGLFDFQGRSCRTDFWFYAIFVALIAFGFWSVVMSIELTRTFGEINQYAAQHPDKVTVSAGPGGYSVSLKEGAAGVGPDFGYLLKWISAIAVVSIGLLAAAAVRRLHDTNRTGAWVLLPMPFLFGSFRLAALVFQDFNSTAEPDFSWFFLGFANNLIYLATLGFVGFLLFRSGTAGENRFGRREMDEES